MPFTRMGKNKREKLGEGGKQMGTGEARIDTPSISERLHTLLGQALA